jgi:hypothetical protein
LSPSGVVAGEGVAPPGVVAGEGVIPPGVVAGEGVIPAGVSAGVVVPSGISAGVVVPSGVSACGWQADRAVTKPTRSKTMTFDFTVNILTIFQFFGLSLILTGNVLFRSPLKERTFWRIFYHES